MGVIEPVNIRAHEAHFRFSSDPHDFFLKFVFSNFSKSGRDEYGAGYAFLTAFSDDTGDKLGRYADCLLYTSDAADE